MRKNARGLIYHKEKMGATPSGQMACNLNSPSQTSRAAYVKQDFYSINRLMLKLSGPIELRSPKMKFMGDEDNDFPGEKSWSCFRPQTHGNFS